MSDRKEQLEKIVGSGNVTDVPEVLDAYARDQSFVPPRSPRLVARPSSADQIQEIVRWANETDTPLLPVSSGPPRFRGDTVPSVGGAVIVDMSGMKRIIRVDRRNRVTMIEPGVTFAELQTELLPHGLKPSIPLLPRRNKSVVASLLEREPILIPKYQWTLLEPLRCLEVIWGDGSKLWTGDAGPWGTLERQWDMKHAQVMPLGWGQADYYRLISGAQGMMGIVTWATVKLEVAPSLHKALFAVSKELEDLLDFAYGLLKIKYADEFFFLNNSDLAYIFGEERAQIPAFRETMPEWVLILGLAGRERLPKERVEYQEADMTDMARKHGLHLLQEIPRVPAQEVMSVLTAPSREPYWKLRYKGGCQDIFFLTTLDNTPKFLEIMYNMAKAYGYPRSDIGVYIQPVNRGVGCHCEFSLPYDQGNEDEVARLREFFVKSSSEIMQAGGFFSRPYGSWAEMAYNRDAQSTMVLQKIKQIFDPHGVMNPGKLCF